ncbi:MULTISPECIES: type I-F CRISPR-associated helicase Cas3f [Pseudomonadota]|uniref:type I-F CRISPR-associated helicase Cas3f n=1 Tax=Pseudomonadota TaxID=1224 RepID=UPI00261D7269|nr:MULTISPECIES: type I-F CRISPR-associated helicase Cas3f [Pseudomonadota]
MNVVLISQCDKRASTETRRILDQFAERRGDHTWQTPITEAGLDTLRKLLRKSARKNTAVACHWIRGVDHSELLWIVGDASRFNANGAVPTNTTARDVLRKDDENDWHTAQAIRLLAHLGALLHDLGKASVAFQQRLQGRRNEKNLYRHEWVSLRLFQAFVGGDDDAGWLARLADTQRADAQDWLAPGRYLRDGLDADIEAHPFRQLPPLAAAVGWLIVTHHRLPVVPVEDERGQQAWLGKRAGAFEKMWLEQPLAQVAHDWNEVRRNAPHAEVIAYWRMAGALPTANADWRAQAARVAGHLLALTPPADGWLGNPYVMHLARLCLMLADHHYSSLGIDAEGRPVVGRARFLQAQDTIHANTIHDRNRRSVFNQTLTEHLLGVGHGASQIAHALPGFERHLPRLARHRGLRKRSGDPRFAWQDKAFDAATTLREAMREHGGFIVNMASTGCGKTLANARILYALADPQQGLRATYALGLRTLTLQTGRAYRQDLQLGEDELAVLVGGAANRALFDYYEQRAEASGSASVQSLLDEDSHVLYEGATADHPLLVRALADADIRKLLSAPMLVCTVDHLTPATESLRAGRQIAPMLRLMSSDLILDELDDYDLNDLPALTRLVHWAGLLGARIVLSSATLPPALLQGMFAAYRTGRKFYRQNRGIPGDAHIKAAIPCLWVDEYGVQAAPCSDMEGFAAEHTGFVARRVQRLHAAPPLHRAELLPLPIKTTSKDALVSAFAGHVRAACLRLHAAHGELDPASGQRVSFGLVRMANIDPIVAVARALLALGAPPGIRIHLCVYHARFPLLLRSATEHMLDTVFNRRDPQAVWRHPQVRAAIDAHPGDEHLFVVLASPVCEVGRDWDADWAVAEPSSMRALIQLAGRIQRHRRTPGEAPNLLVFARNLKAVEHADGCTPVYCRPGFEKDTHDDRFLLASHDLNTLLRHEEYARLTAAPRIQPQPAEARQPRQRLVDLEHARIEASMLAATPTAPGTSRRRSATAAPGLERDHAAAAWQYPQAALIGVLPQQQPFRDDSERKATLAFLPDEDGEALVPHRVEDDPGKRGQTLYVSAPEMVKSVALESAEGIDLWGRFDLLTLLQEQAEHLDLPLELAARKFTTVEVPCNDGTLGWQWNPALGLIEYR